MGCFFSPYPVLDEEQQADAIDTLIMVSSALGERISSIADIKGLGDRLKARIIERETRIAELQTLVVSKSSVYLLREAKRRQADEREAQREAPANG